LQKGTFTDWKYSNHFKLDQTLQIDRNKISKKFRELKTVQAGKEKLTDIQAKFTKD